MSDNSGQTLRRERDAHRFGKLGSPGRGAMLEQRAKYLGTPVGRAWQRTYTVPAAKVFGSIAAGASLATVVAPEAEPVAIVASVFSASLDCGFNSGEACNASSILLLARFAGRAAGIMRGVGFDEKVGAVSGVGVGDILGGCPHQRGPDWARCGRIRTSMGMRSSPPTTPAPVWPGMLRMTWWPAWRTDRAYWPGGAAPLRRGGPRTRAVSPLATGPSVWDS